MLAVERQTLQPASSYPQIKVSLCLECMNTVQRRHVNTCAKTLKQDFHILFVHNNKKLFTLLYFVGDIIFPQIKC